MYNTFADNTSLDSFYDEINILCEKNLRISSPQITECVSSIPQLLSVPRMDSVVDPSWTFLNYLQYIILRIVRPENDESSITEQLSPHQMKLILLWINSVADLCLVPNIDAQLLANQVMQREIKQLPARVDFTEKQRLCLLTSSVNCLSLVFQVNELLTNIQPSSMIGLKYLAGIHSTIQHQSLGDGFTDRLLNDLFERIPEQYFRFLLMLKSTTGLKKGLSEQLHQDLLQRLLAPNGFEILCKVLCPQTVPQDGEGSRLKTVAVIAGIVGRAGHSKEFYSRMVAQIGMTIQRALDGQTDEQFLGIAMGSLNRIYKLPLPEIRGIVEGSLFDELKQLSHPEDVITGNIIFEHQQMVNIFRRLRLAFVGSPALTFPSKLLIPFLPLFLQLSNKLTTTDDHLQDIITRLVTRCLANRQSTELGDLIDSLLLEEYLPTAQQLHPRILFQQTTCQIGQATQCTFYNPSEVLVTLLKSSNNNLLIYNIFLHLLNQLDQCLLESNSHNQSSSFADNLDEMTQLVALVFKRRIAVIGSLTELISHTPFHGQFNENPAATIECLTNLLRRQISSHSEESDPIMLVVLSVIRELLEKLKHSPDHFRPFLAALKEYRLITTDPAIRNHIDGILQLIDGNEDICPLPEESAFEAARTLCSAAEPHLKVYGMVQFTKLIRQGSDPEVLAKRHAILALAIDALRDPDSYVFLNCIRLLVQLVDVLEAEVLEAMVVEYRTEGGGEVDFRLKVGEVMVKVTEMLGEFFVL